MVTDILPSGPSERRRRDRLYALRALDRLGLLGEENLVTTLTNTPALRWLADEAGARWGILRELGRIREPRAFEAAVRWVIEARPHTERAEIEIRRFRVGAIRPAGSSAGGSIGHGADGFEHAPLLSAEPQRGSVRQRSQHQ